jgi:hypothetical protein
MRQLLILIAIAPIACAAGPRHLREKTAVSAQPVTLTSAAAPGNAGAADAWSPAPIAAPPVESAPLEQWTKRYPDAAFQLEEWVRHNRQAASELSAFDRAQPEKFRVLVLWSITHPFEGLAAFMVDRLGWESLGSLRQEHRAEMEGFMDWCRRAPSAAAELVSHSAPFAWLGEHSYGPR